MNEAINKISAYEFLNVLFPGVLLGVYVIELFDVSVVDDNNVLFQTIVLLCIAYFLGLVISRIGSLLVEPIARRVGLIRWSEYYYEAEKIDKRLIILLKDLNMYRNIVSLALTIFAVTVSKRLFGLPISSLELCLRLSMASLIFMLFLLSYRKQSILIEKRINRVRKGCRK